MYEWIDWNWWGRFVGWQFSIMVFVYVSGYLWGVLK